MIEIFRTLFKYKEKESPDELGFFPEKVHVEAFPERRYLWASRFLVILSVLSICFNMMLASTIYLLLPQITVAPRFFSINNDFHQIELVQEKEIKYSVSDLITEKYINEYLRLRYTISDNVREMQQRWKKGGYFYWYTTTNIYEEFLVADMDVAINKAKKQGLQRYVDVDWVRPLSRGLWQAQFKMYDILPNREPRATYWRATMQIMYANLKTMSKTTRMLNPYGFLIHEYSLSYIGSDSENESYIETARKRSQVKR